MSWRRIQEGKYNDLLKTDKWDEGSTLASVFTDSTFSTYSGTSPKVVSYLTPHGVDDLQIFCPWAQTSS